MKYAKELKILGISFKCYLRVIGYNMCLTLNVACFYDYSQNGKFSYGYASSPGKRSSMEDFYETRIDGVEGEIVGLFGVFDGTFSLPPFNL